MILKNRLLLFVIRNVNGIGDEFASLAILLAYFLEFSGGGGGRDLVFVDVFFLVLHAVYFTSYKSQIIGPKYKSNYK